MLKWKAEMEVGHEQFDRDHRQLIAMANLLGDALQLGDATQANALACDLQAKAALHSEHEQSLLRAIRGEVGPMAEAHNRVGDLAAAVRLVVQAGEMALATRLMAILEDSIADAVEADRRAFAAVPARATAG